MNSGDDTSRGRGRSTATSLSTRPGPALITTTRSASSAASSTEWVTKMHGNSGARPDLQEFVLQLFARQRIERAERLVHQQDIGIVGKHAGDRDPLLHSAGKLVRIAVGKALEPDHSTKFVGESASISARGSRRCRGPKPIFSRTVIQGNSA